MKKLLILTLLFVGCEDNHTSRDKSYRIHAIKSGQVQIKWLDSAYAAGDTIALPFDSTNAVEYVILKRVE